MGHPGPVTVHVSDPLHQVEDRHSRYYHAIFESSFHTEGQLFPHQYTWKFFETEHPGEVVIIDAFIYLFLIVVPVSNSFHCVYFSKDLHIVALVVLMRGGSVLAIKEVFVRRIGSTDLHENILSKNFASSNSHSFDDVKEPGTVYSI